MSHALLMHLVRSRSRSGECGGFCLCGLGSLALLRRQRRCRDRRRSAQTVIVIQHNIVYSRASVDSGTAK